MNHFDCKIKQTPSNSQKISTKIIETGGGELRFNSASFSSRQSVKTHPPRKSGTKTSDPIVPLC